MIEVLQNNCTFSTILVIGEPLSQVSTLVSAIYTRTISLQTLLACSNNHWVCWLPWNHLIPVYVFRVASLPWLCYLKVYLNYPTFVHWANSRNSSTGRNIPGISEHGYHIPVLGPSDRCQVIKQYSTVHSCYGPYALGVSYLVLTWCTNIPAGHITAAQRRLCTSGRNHP